MHSLHSRVVMVGVAVSIAAAASITTAAPAFAAPTDASQTFSANGTVQTWTVPNDVTQIYVDLAGGQGGASYGGGGLGAELTGALTVTPGETLNVVAGSYGGNGTLYAGGAGGGGGSFIFTTADQSGILAAAGGGGGAASNNGASSASISTSGTAGGNGGGAGGTDGNGGQASSAGGGGGLLSDGGGNGGQSVGGGASGGPGGIWGGGGGFGGGGGSQSYAGGGGGGYSGGGGGNYNGNNGGGGGGGSYLAGSLTGAVIDHGGDGFVTIYYPSVLTSLSPALGLAGRSLTIDGSGLAGATVTIGGVAATVTSSSDAQLVATIPVQSPLPGGALRVDVATAGGVTLPAVGAFAYLPAPTVAAVTPATIEQGSAPTVTITGTGFTGATAVYFGAAPAASFTVISDTTITATVPSSLPSGTVDTTIVSPDGTSATSAADQLTVTPAAPSVSALSPISGPTNGGTDVTVTGTGFTGATSVMIGSTPVASFTVASPTRITVVTSASAAGEFTVTVTTPDGTSATSASARFTFVAAPTVTGVSPASGTVSGGTSVTITGTGFTSASAVDFGDIASSYTVNSDTSITAVTPTSSVGTVDVTVTTVGGVSAMSLADQFTFDPAAAAPGVLGLTGIDVETQLMIAGGLLLTGLVAGAFAHIARRRRETR